MSIYDKSSLVLIPSGTKTGKIFSQKPVSGDGDFTFTRASAATRVNADGNIEKETMNLILQSNSFDTAWTLTNATLTSGQSGYDGSNDAWLLNATDVFSSVRQSISKSGVQTLSVYAKAGSYNFVRVACYDGSSIYDSYFDLQNGILGTSLNAIDANIQSVGGGWYKCSVSVNVNTTEVRIYSAIADNNGFGTNGSIYIQDAQLEQGLVARDYIETTTAAVYGGITDNTPRLDYTDSSCPALLLEPLRTNRVTNSEYLNGDWSANRSTLIVNDDTSPEGVNNATKLQEDTTASNTHFTGKGYTYVSGTTYSWSVYAKADGRDEIAIQQGNPSVISFNAVFNFTSETATNFGNGTARIEDAGNGWYRCIIEGTTALLSSGTNINVFLRSGNSTTYTGDGTSGVLFYGFQLEEGSYATSYIPTYGAGSVTRVAETCGDAGTSATFNSTEGVLYVEVAALADDLTNRYITISDGTANNRLSVFFTTASNKVIFSLYVGGVLQSYISNSSTDITQINKIACKWKENDFALWVNGVEVATDTNGITFPVNTLDRLDLSYTITNLFNFNGKAKQVLVFPTALSDEELAALTTI